MNARLPGAHLPEAISIICPKELYLLPEGIDSFTRSKLCHLVQKPSFLLKQSCSLGPYNDCHNNVSFKMTIWQYSVRYVKLYYASDTNSLGQLIQSLRANDTLFPSFGKMTQFASGNIYNPFGQMIQIVLGKCHWASETWPNIHRLLFNKNLDGNFTTNKSPTLYF